MLLALETATTVCSVALASGDEISEKRSVEGGAHSENLFIFINELMEEYQIGMDDISAILLSAGPGSYTGLRIGASGVKGLLFGSGIPLYSVPTLASFAMAAFSENREAERIHAIIDARRSHLYHQLFLAEKGILRSYEDLQVRPITQCEDLIKAGEIIIGTGSNRLDSQTTEQCQLLKMDAISARSLIGLYRSSSALASIRKVEAAQFDPHYYSSNQLPNDTSKN